MPTVIHSVNPYLEPTTVWIHDQIKSLERYTPVVYGRYVRNLERFPVDRIVDFTSHGSLTGLLDRVVTRTRGTYPRYGAQAVRDGADLIHAHFGQEGFRCLKAKKIARIPLVTTFYGLDVSALPRIPVWQRRFTRLFDEGDLFLAEGPHMAACLVGIGCPETKVRIQPLGIDLAAFPYKGIEERVGSPEVLMYASLREKKGHRYGIDAFAQLARDRDDIRMSIVGDGPLRSTLEAHVDELGISERVTFLGSLPHDECQPILQRAHVLLSPSITASDGDTEGGAPVGIIEALATGLPVVATHHADIPFVLNEGEAGLLVEERDTAGLTVALARALEADEAVGARSLYGRQIVAERHTLAAQGESLEARYDEVLSRPGSET